MGLVSSPVRAQFAKPLSNSSSNLMTTEAKYNIGLIGGASMTQWIHFGGTETDFNYSFNYGPTAGLALERMLSRNVSVALEGLFAMRNMQLNYDVLNFPVALNQNKDYYRQYEVDYQEVDVQVPVTFYLSDGKVRPYVFLGPRFSLPLSGKMVWQKKEILNYGTPEQQFSETGATIDTVAMNAHSLRDWNVGLVAGAGVLFKINTGNYYLLLKLDASAHAAVFNSFAKEEINGEASHVIGAAYIDPYLLGKRYNTDATVKLTLMFPLKKQLKGACMKWGEYD